MSNSIWQEKVIVITGGSSGIGKAIAIEYISRNAGHIVCASSNKQKLDDCIIELQSIIAASGNSNTTVSMSLVDVKSADECRLLIDNVVAQYNRLDVLINSAGIWLEGNTEDMNEDDYDTVMDTNLKGAFFTIKYAIPHLDRTKGQIINIASDAGIIGNKYASLYCASKGGLILLTKSIAVELAPRGIRCNAICPADVDTSMLQKQASDYSKTNPDEYYAMLRKNYPQGESMTRFIRPDEVATFTVSISEIEAITGAELKIDFGTTAGR